MIDNQYVMITPITLAGLLICFGILILISDDYDNINYN